MPVVGEDLTGPVEGRIAAPDLRAVSIEYEASGRFDQSLPRQSVRRIGESTFGEFGEDLSDARVARPRNEEHGTPT